MPMKMPKKYAVKQGTLIIDDNGMRVQAPLQGTLWSVRHDQVSSLDRTPGFPLNKLHIHLKDASTRTVELGGRFAAQIMEFYNNR